MQSDWKSTVRNFIDTLPEEGFWSVKHLCLGLLNEKEYATAEYWKNEPTENVLAWLSDCKHESEQRLRFEQKWSILPNMENVAVYTKQEITKIQELIDALGSE